jgi:hypothetical protein
MYDLSHKFNDFGNEIKNVLIYKYENFYAKLVTCNNCEKLIIFERIKSHAIHVGSFVRIICKSNREPKLEPKRPIQLELRRAFKRHRRSRYMGKQPFMVSLKIFFRFSWTKLWSIQQNRA